MSRSFRRKPLEWRTLALQAGFSAYVPPRGYRVYYDQKDHFEVWVHLAGAYSDLGNFYNLEAAKAAAEEHWQAQPPPEGYEAVTVCPCGGGYAADHEAEDWRVCPDCAGAGFLVVEDEGND